MIRFPRAARRRSIALLCAVSALALPGVAIAQTTAAADTPEPAAAPHSGLEDIVVTARRKVENLQNVPVSATALSAAQLQRYDLTNLEKISSQTPQFTVGRASNGSGATLTLRGIGSSSTSIGIEQSVAVVVDSVYYGQGRIINEGFFDLGRLEILKGPQALFFGKNATAGVVSITSNDPTDKPEYLVRGGYEFNAQQVYGEAILSGPVTDTLGLRLAVRGSKMFGGYFDNAGQDVTYNTADVATGITTPHPAKAYDRDNPGEREFLGRLTAVWKPDDRLSVTLKGTGDINRNDNNSWNYVTYACSTGFSQLNPSLKCGHDFKISQNYFPQGFGIDPHARSDLGLYNDYTSYAVTGTIVYQLPNMTFTSVNNYNHNANSWACSCTFVSNGPTLSPSNESTTFHALSSEERVQTTYDGPINLLAGFLYQKTRRNYHQDGAFAGIENTAAPNPAFRYLAYDKISHTDGETLAGYGQVTWKVLPTVEAAAGVRYTHETKDSLLNQPYINPALVTVFLPNTPIAANQTFSNWSPEATLSWKPSRNITIYGAYKTAYKSGGFSNSGFVSAGTTVNDVAFRPERASGFEGGIKTTLLDNQLRVNIGAYHYKYKDLQVDFFNSATFAFITTNAGAAKTDGVELETEYAPRAVPGLNLHGTLNYNHARYANYIAPCYGGQTPAEGCDTTFRGAPGQDLSDRPTAVAPRWTASFGSSYDIPLGGNLVLSLSGDGRYSSGYFASSFAMPLSRQNAYVSIDASARVKTVDDRWELALIGRNLSNHFIVTGAVDGPNTGSGTGTAAGRIADEVGYVSLPRTVAIQLTWRY
jgi:iron complex outermembrane recepter protein